MTAIPHRMLGDHDLAHDHAHEHVELGFLKKYLFSVDHKTIGIQFLFLGLFFMVIGGLLAMLIRWQLAYPSDPTHPVPILGKLMGWTNGVMPPEFYTMVFSMHATIMIFFVIIPLLVGTFGNYLIPLKIGAGDMAFPFLNGLAFWSAVPAGAIMLAGFSLAGGAAAAGWTSYPPLSAIVTNAGTQPYVYPISTSERIVQFLRPNVPTAAFNASVIASGRFVLEYQGNPSVMAEAVRGAAAELKLADLTINNNTAPYYDAQGVRKSGELSVTGADWTPALQTAVAARITGGGQSTWPTFPILLNFAGFFLLFAYISAYYVRLGHPAINGVVGTILSLAAAVMLTRGVQYVAWDGQSCWFLSLFLLGFSSLMGAVNYLTTIIKLRAPGMTMFRLPLSVWSLFITSILVLLATPVLASTLMMNLMEHQVISADIAGSTVRLANFFTPYNWTLSNQIQGNAGGGYPLMHQHLFWFYSHPAVYIMILPAMGMVSDVLAVFARKPIFGYRPMVYAMAGIAFLGFIVWAHHMFQSGMNPTLGTTFAVSTIFIAVPSAIKVFNWLGTLWGGNIRYTTAMWNAITFVAMFLIGGLSGIFMAQTAVDVHIHDTYFIVAHIHYVLFGGSMFGIFAGIYFWYPKMFGRMMSEKLGYLHFWLTLIFFNGTFFAMHILGMGGFPRRVADFTNYEIFADYLPMNRFISYCAFGLGLSQIPFVINFIGSWIWGRKAPGNPWEATTLEWADTTSPPPHGNFAKVPVVHHGPYEYSSPLVEEDWLAQTRYVEGADEFAAAQKH